ncbi:flavin-containing monooxygenase [Parahaliea mediterranea]|uniref:NAD(P)/FAD-dependent oxidoreductase n=1 Tax=Parahaliea mediterranea TaxID=651086 RepID=A0A939IIR8_9GAMM|nr:NAD(P)/FAD-dependent oxidoreductase [Parahaliea mediterranea]MBN7796889.1 NAD(P)/FAD-dependent oxidoreductase [Parahaliea mediterranea]
MNQQHYDIAIIGAGFAGLYMLIRARRLGLSARVIEAAPDVGGTWYWNCYPGCRCDVESVEYSYEFDQQLQQEWEWPERFSAQPDILAYINHVAQRYELRPDIAFNTTVNALQFDEEAGRWAVTTDTGDNFQARYVVAATGSLSVPLFPAIEGRERFRGLSVHTGQWPRAGVDLAGKRVAVIGTGSSGIQAIPEIAREAAQLDVYVRTPSYTAPARNRDLTPEELAGIKQRYDTLRADEKNRFGGFGANHPDVQVTMAEHSDAERRASLEQWWQIGGLQFILAYPDSLLDPDTNRVMADFVREKVAALIDDPADAAVLMPRGVLGSRRLCSDTDFYTTFNRDNVRVMDAKNHPIQRITETGIETDLGPEAYDVIVYATGFDAMTGALEKIDIRGREGLSLRERWRDGPANYLGLQVAGFPNLFMVNGPGSVSVFSNMVQTIEHHVDFIANCIGGLEQSGAATIEATAAAEEAWGALMAEAADETLLATEDSWYVGSNVPGKPRMMMAFVGSYPVYREYCQQVVERDYEGFAIN